MSLEYLQWIVLPFLSRHDLDRFFTLSQTMRNGSQFSDMSTRKIWFFIDHDACRDLSLALPHDKNLIFINRIAFFGKNFLKERNQFGQFGII